MNVKRLIGLFALTPWLLVNTANAQSTAWMESFGPSNGIGGDIEVCKTYTGADTLVIQYVHARGVAGAMQVLIAIDGPQNRRAVQTFVLPQNPDSASAARVLNEVIRMYATNGSEICVSVQGSFDPGLQTDLVTPIRLTGTIDSALAPPADQVAVNP